jgi:hypothetical protein
MLLLAAYRPRCITIIPDFLDNFSRCCSTSCIHAVVSSTLLAVVANAPTFKIVPDDFVCHPAINMILKVKTPGLYRGFLYFGHLSRTFQGGTKAVRDYKGLSPVFKKRVCRSMTYSRANCLNTLHLLLNLSVYCQTNK